MKSKCKYTHVRTYNTNTHKRNSYNNDNSYEIKSKCKYTHVRTYNTNTHKRNSYNNDKKNKHNIIRMMIVMKSKCKCTHVRTYNANTNTHKNVIVIIMIT